jgi:glycosyltransferase involved in cell wall biosynthesis
VKADCIDIPYSPRELIPETIAAADICPLCYPSHYVGSPQRMLEYMSMGKVISTPPYPGIQGFLDAGNSLFVGYENLENNYRDSILRVYRNGALRIELEDRVRKRAEEQLSLHMLSAKMQEFLSSVFG